MVEPVSSAREAISKIFITRAIDPLPGWEWVFQHYNDPPPPCEMVLCYEGKKVAELSGSIKRGAVAGIVHSFQEQVGVEERGHKCPG